MASILKFLPRGFVFQPSELRLIDTAFETTVAQHPSVSHDAVAAAIFRSAQSGERDPEILLAAALTAVKSQPASVH